MTNRTEDNMSDVFKTLSQINVNDKTEQKNGLTYLSWAWAWGEVKKAYPEATYTIYENENGWNYFTDGKTCWVKTGVTINGLEHIEYLPVMDYRNKSIPLEDVTSFDINKAIQRSMTKACARHGLGLYIYAGEDLPEERNEVLKVDKHSAEYIKRTLKEFKLNESKLIATYGKGAKKVEDLEQGVAREFIKVLDEYKAKKQAEGTTNAGA